MKKIPLCLALLVLSLVCKAQEITMYRTFGGVGFEIDTVSYSPKQILRILNSNPQAYMEFKKAKSKYDVSGILGFAGVVLIAVPLTSAIFGGEPEWGLAAGGALLVGASIPLNLSFRRHALNAIDTYNSGLSSSRAKPSAHLFLSGTALGFTIKF